MPATDALASAAMSELAASGVRLMCGVPGDPSLVLIDKGAEAGIRFVLTHGETAACIAAGVYGGLTGAPGAAAVTRGPGAASAVNGMAQATLDRFPLILLSDAVPAAERGWAAHQRFDQQQMMTPVAKWSGTLGCVNTAGTARRAARLATAYPPGGVHLDFDPTAPGGTPPHPPRPAAPDPAALKRARELASASRRPVFLIGAGAVPWAGAVRSLVEGLGAPALVTYQAKGVIPDSSPSYGGLFTNSASEQALIEKADLIAAVELDPVEPLARPWPYRTPVLAVNTRPLTDSYYPVAAEVTGLLDAALAGLRGSFASDWPAGSGPAAAARVREDLYAEGPGFTPFELMEAVAEAGPEDPVVTVDAGAHFLVVMPCWEVHRPLDLLISNGLATMGFALPAAMGAALARPGRPVLCLTGDGGMSMTLAELETVARLGLDITVVVFNDSALSLIAIKRGSEAPEGVNAVDYGPIDYAAAARALGMEGHAAESPEEVRRALAAGRGPRLIDARIDPGAYTHVIRTARG